MNLPDLSQFDPAQQQAFFDLLILTMYADGKLTAIEDDYLKQLLKSMNKDDRALDEAVTRTRPSLASLHLAKSRLVELADMFTTRRQHLQVYGAVEAMVLNDGHVAGWESDLLSELRLKFRV